MTEHGEGSVYEAAEDTFTLARGLDSLFPLVDLAAEIGCGSGLITEVLTAHASEVVATDVNRASAYVTWQRIKGRKLDQVVHVICCDRLEAVRMGELFDLIAFNPPYLPEEGDSRWAGGPTGIEVPLAFASSALKRLKRKGLMLFLLSSLSNWTEALRKLRSMGCVVSVVRAERLGLFEDLLLTLCVRKAIYAGDTHS